MIGDQTRTAPTSSGYWLLAIGYRLLAIGYWLLATGYRLLAVLGPLYGRGHS
jgi:hypothetical protein